MTPPRSALSRAIRLLALFVASLVACTALAVASANAEDDPILGPAPEYYGIDATISDLDVEGSTVGEYTRKTAGIDAYLDAAGQKSRHLAYACNRKGNLGPITIRGSASTTSFKVYYFNRSGVNITAKVVAGTWRTPNLAKNQCATVHIRIVRNAAAVDGASRRYFLSFTPANTNHDRDVVYVRAIAR